MRLALGSPGPQWPVQFNQQWHIPGAINHQPLNSLRSGYAELDRSRPLFVYCRVGFRGYLASRILMQRGYREVFNLSAGALTFSSVYPTLYSTGQADYPFVAHAKDQMLKS